MSGCCPGLSQIPLWLVILPSLEKVITPRVKCAFATSFDLHGVRRRNIPVCLVQPFSPHCSSTVAVFLSNFGVMVMVLVGVGVGVRVRVQRLFLRTAQRSFSSPTALDPGSGKGEFDP